MEVLFAPDWRAGVPYQTLLAEALVAQGVEVEFLSDYKRILPLTRLVRAARKARPYELLHLHWPEAYFHRKNDGFDWWRLARFPVDLALATRGRPMVLTAHNLHTHNHAGKAFEDRNTRAAIGCASRVLTHSGAAKAWIVEHYGVPETEVAVVPHGDLSAALGPPEERGIARDKLGLGAEKICLMFGAVEPYKGIEDVLEWWWRVRPEMQLVIAGRPGNSAYAAALARAADGIPNVRLFLGHLPEAELRRWLSAADCALFNYRHIFTSGAASLTRSYGLPMLLPRRLTTLDLGEPSPLVLRFDDFRTDFAAQLAATLAVAPDYAAAAAWRDRTAWPRVAALTAAVYRDALACGL